MHRRIVSLAACLGIASVFASPAVLQERRTFVEERGGFDVSGPYQVDPNWPKKTWPARGYIWGSQSGVYPESPDRVFLTSRGEIELPKDARIGPNFPGNWGALNRGGATGEVPVFRNTILIIDRQGSLIESWTQWDSLFEGGRGPHQIYVQPYDPERHVWVVDDMNHVIHKFTNDGKTKVFTLGEMGVFGSNDDMERFNRPTMIDWLPDGTFFVSDGYNNTRVVKFDRTGKFIMDWGMKGNPPNETRPYYMNTVHAIVTDKQRRLYVSDRANHRIQVFDENGKFLEAWPGVPLPYSLLLTDDGFFWSASGQTQKFTKYDLNGRLLAAWGTFGTIPGGFWGVHQFHVDSEGNLYTADVHVGRPQKLRPKPNLPASERARLISPPIRPVRTVTTSSSN